MKYSGDYIKESVQAFGEQFEEGYERAQYSIDVDGGFREPPILKLCQFMQDTSNIEMQDLMVRHCILDRQVSVYLDDELVGSFHRNNLDDAWEAIPLIGEHPKAYEFLANIVTGFLAKKFILPRKKTSAKVAVVKVKRQHESDEK